MGPWVIEDMTVIGLNLERQHRKTLLCRHRWPAPSRGIHPLDPSRDSKSQRRHQLNYSRKLKNEAQGTSNHWESRSSDSALAPAPMCCLLLTHLYPGMQPVTAQESGSRQPTGRPGLSSLYLFQPGFSWPLHSVNEIQWDVSLSVNVYVS